MSNPHFMNRFKDKSSLSSTNGNLPLNPKNAISKPQASQLHSSIIQSSATYILHPHPTSDPSHLSNPSLISFSSDKNLAFNPSTNLPSNIIYPKPIKKLQNHSTSPAIISPIPNRLHVNRSYEEKPPKPFKPYTLNDYNSIKPTGYYKLGGLGASIGSEEWVRKKAVNDKRSVYGKNIYIINSKKLPLLPNIAKKLQEENSRTRALNFANTITKPTLKLSILQHDI